MIQITPQMRIVVAIEPADFRKGIDGLAQICKDVQQKPNPPHRGPDAAGISTACGRCSLQ